jgi:hypothetical protein
LIGCAPVKTRVRSAAVVEVEITADRCAGLGHAVVGFEIVTIHGNQRAMFAAIRRASTLVGPAWRLPPFPFAGLPVVAGDAALDHFVAPLIALNAPNGHHNDDLQQQLTRSLAA